MDDSWNVDALVDEALDKSDKESISDKKKGIGISKKNFYYGITGFIVSFLVFSSLLFPIWNNKSGLDVITDFLSNIDTDDIVADEIIIVEPYIYTDFVAPVNSFGMSSTTFKFVNWSFFKQLFSSHCSWMLEYDAGNGWMDGNKYLSIEKTWNESLGGWKFNLIFTKPPSGILDARFTFGCDLPVLDYVERDGWQVNLNYTVPNTDEVYNCFFNWSDMANIPGVVFNKGVQDDIFWFRFRRDNIPANSETMIYEFDPSFGNSGGAKNGHVDLEDNIKGQNCTAPEAGTVDNIAIYPYGWWGTGETIKCAIYDSGDGSLIAQTEPHIGNPLGDNTINWVDFVFNTTVNIEADKEYVLAAWGGNSTNGEHVYYTTGINGYRYKNGVTYTGDFPSSVSFSESSGYAACIYANYSVSTVNVAPEVSNPYPANESTDISIGTNLSFMINDFNDDTMDVTVYAELLKRYNYDNDSIVTSDLTVDHPTRMPHQRTVFYAQDRYWVFYQNKTGSYEKLFYQTSSDGINWDNPIAIMGNKNEDEHAEFTCHVTEGKYIYVVVAYDTINNVTGGYDNSYRKGVLSDDGSISWNYSWQNFADDDTYILWDSHMTVDSNGDVWIGFLNDTFPNYKPVIWKSDDNTDSGWSNASGFPLELYTGSERDMYWSMPESIDNGGVYLFIPYGYFTGHGWLYGRYWDGDSWDSEENLTTRWVTSTYWGHSATVGMDDNAHIVFIENNTQLVHGVKNVSSGSYTEYIVTDDYVSSNTAAYHNTTAPTLCKTDDGSLICMWIYDNTTYMGHWNTTHTTWVIKELFTETGLYDSGISIAYEETNDTIPYVYNEDHNGNSIKLGWLNESTDTSLEYGIIDYNESLSNGTVDIDKNNMFGDYSYTYYWYVNISDDTVFNNSDIYHFTTGDAPASWQAINNFNGTIQNSSVVFNEVSDFNGSIFNNSIFNNIVSWNGSLYNQSSYINIQDYNGSIFNSSGYISVGLWNGSFYNSSVLSWNIINNFNGSIYNDSSWYLKTLWNGTIANLSVDWQNINDYNGSIYNQSSYDSIDNFNGSIYNLSVDEWHSVSNWNGTIVNLSVDFQIITTFNGSIYNNTIFSIISNYNGSIYNYTGYTTIITWDGTIYNGTPHSWQQIEKWDGLRIYNGTGIKMIRTSSNNYLVIYLLFGFLFGFISIFFINENKRRKR